MANAKGITTKLKKGIATRLANIEIIDTNPKFLIKIGNVNSWIKNDVLAIKIK